MGSAHYAVYFLLGNERGNAVDYYNINCARAHECFCYFQCLLAAVRLRNKQTVDIHAQRLGINRVERMLGIDKCRFAAHSLNLGYHMECNGCFTGGFGPEYFYDSAARNGADTERKVKRE